MEEELEGIFTRVTVQTSNGQREFNKAIFQYDDNGILTIYEEGKLVSAFKVWESVASKSYSEKAERILGEAILEDWRRRENSESK